MSTKKVYGEKLRDPRWQKLRLEIMNRDGFACKLCHDAKSTLNIHHLKYEREPWDCAPEYLITLCEDCHYIVTFLAFDMLNETIEIRKIIRPKHTAFIALSSLGASFFVKLHGKQPELHGQVSHDVLKFVVHDILNYWLKTDQEHYLTEKLPAVHG
jgi:hypothetical protein